MKDYLNHCCGECVYLVTEDGEPFYCLNSELYYFRKKEDRACPDVNLADDEEINIDEIKILQ